MIKTIQYQNNHTLAYADFGNPHGRPILIQHGMIASIQDGQLFNRLVDAGARLISIARPGYGQSTPYEMKNIGEYGDIVSVLVNELKLAQFDVLGISSGAPYSYAVAHALPTQTRKLFILNGIPALYDDRVASHWPHPITQNATIAEMRAVAHQVFFSSLTPEDSARDDIKDSMMHSCFGVAQDLRLRCMDWGFRLSDVKTSVVMRHSRADGPESLITAQRTAEMLPNCRLEVQENDPHFSQEVLDQFITDIMLNY